MSVFRQRRFGLLLLAVFVSVMLIWRPWGGLGLQARGLNFGVDIAGGSRAVLWLENSVTASMHADTISKLQARIDPYGLLGTRFRTLGENCILCETTQLNDRTKELLTKQGRLELFIGTGLVLTDEDITSFGAPTSAGSVYSSIPIKYTEEGGQKLKVVAEASGKSAGVVYLDRPSDAILIFDEEMLKETPQLTYDNSTRMFVYMTREELQYTLLVPAVGTSLEDLSPQALDYLENQAGAKQRVLLLGSMENFTHVIEKIPASYRVENISRLKGESEYKWVKRAYGIISDFQVSLGVGSDRIIVEANLQDTRDIRTILSSKTPTELRIVPNSETEVEASLGGGFVREALVAGAVALAGVFSLIYFRYRRWKICLAIIGITMCEFAITLGATSVLGLAIGLPEIGGLLLVIGTGIDHQLIVTDEMLQGGSHQAKSVSVGWRASRALIMIYAAMSVIIAATIPIALLGFSAIRGFTIITISGTILALLFTRSFYAKIIDAISAS
jgi:preprotein translocase subunit SecD